MRIVRIFGFRDRSFYGILRRWVSTFIFILFFVRLREFVCSGLMKVTFRRFFVDMVFILFRRLFFVGFYIGYRV